MMFAFSSNAMFPKEQASQEKLKVKRPVAVNIKKKTETEKSESKVYDSKQSDKKITEKNWLMEVQKLNYSRALNQLASHCSFKSIKKM